MVGVSFCRGAYRKRGRLSRLVVEAVATVRGTGADVPGTILDYHISSCLCPPLYMI